VLAAGTQLGPYVIIAPIGAGGMGEVYRAKDTRLDREVAIKVLPEQFASDADRLARFQREAKAIAALSHPNILGIHDFGTHAGNCFAVMELLEGETLRSRLTQSAVNWRAALEYGASIADGLSSAHAKGVIHRDLKPENLFLTTDGQVKILDFGLARIDRPSPPQAETASYEAAETEPGVVMGTVGYMSPEQIRGKPVDARTDVFSFGCVLYEMLSGKRPFARETRADVLAATLTDDPPPLRATQSEIPNEVDGVVRHCIEKSAEKRYQSARDLAFDLRAIHAGSSVTKTFVGSARSGRRGLLAAVVCVAALAAVASAMFLPRLFKRSQIDAIAVMPFDSSGDGSSAEELSEGIPDGIIKSLYSVRGLKVRPFGSVLVYKGQKPDNARIRSELKVQAALTGRVVQKGEALSISVELIDLRDNYGIWGEVYSRTLSDVLALQDEICRTITRKLRIQLTGEEERLLSQGHTRHPEAFKQFIKGRFYFNKGNPEDTPQAMECFNKAVEIDPNYAQAYVGIAECYYWQSNLLKAPVEVIPQAKAAAKKAIELDETLGDAHALLGLFFCNYDWDFVEGEKSFQRAVQLSPNSAMVRMYYGLCLSQDPRSAERALAEARRARELDPSSIYTQMYSIYPLYFMRIEGDAVNQLNAVLEAGGDNFLAYAYLGLFYEQRRDYPKAIEAFRKAIELGAPSEAKAQLAHAAAMAGMRDEALRAIDELKELSKTAYVSPYNIAIVYTGLGDEEQTHRAELLRQAAETFRCMFPIATFGWFAGSRDDLDCDVLFASVQKLGRPDHIARVDPRRFEYVIVDEVHHAAAPTYRRILNHLLPQFLLGLTATPDRADEADILNLFDDHLAYRADLGRGIHNGVLVPFQYYGIRDTTDYQPIPWRNSRFDPQVLSSAVQTQARMERMWEAWQRYPAGRTVIFCCSITHACFVRDWLSRFGVWPLDLPSIEFPGLKVLAEAGRGAIGVVYRAQDLRNNRIVALKVLLLGDSTERQVRVDCFFREARVLALLTPHTNIPTLHAVGEIQSQPFYIREFVEGTTLKDRVDARSIHESEGIQALTSIEAALVKVHQRGIIHRNLQPENILIAMDGIAKLIGFGRAAAIEGDVGLSTKTAMFEADRQGLQALRNWLLSAIG
jgi:serine/threonine protein kinase/tetratricopeptide (TPR) repeat protein